MSCTPQVNQGDSVGQLLQLDSELLKLPILTHEIAFGEAAFAHITRHMSLAAQISVIAATSLLALNAV